MNSSKKSNKISLKKIAYNPVTLILSIVFGILAGKYLPAISPFTRFFATIYMKLLQMGVLPLAFAAVSVNISTLLNKEYRSVLAKVVASSAAVLIISSLVGTCTGVVFKDYLAPSEETKTFIVSLQDTEKDEEGFVPEFEEISFYESVDEEIVQEVTFSLDNFFVSLIPENIFEALNMGRILSIIFFSAVLGIMLSFIDPSYSTSLINALDAVYILFCKFINVILSVLPLGMFCILANQFSNLGMESILTALMKLIIMIYVVCIIIILLMFIVIQLKTKCSVKNHLKAIQRTFFLAISTSSCLATLSVVTEDIIKHFKLKESITRSVVPIMITTIQSGVIASTAVVMVFAALLYGLPLNINTVLLIFVGSIFYAFSIIGVPGLVAATMLSIITIPLGIPSDVVSIIAISIVIFFDPIAVFSSVYCDVAVATCIVPKEANVKEIE